ncbi:MAG: flippase-like domain-containing protein, partial [Gammaproteobacteria bacterium]
MNYLKLGFLFFGLLLFGLVVRDLDLLDVARQVAQVGAPGILAMVLLYAVTFGADVAGWQLTLSNVPLDLRWLGRLYGVRMIGEAFNNVTPFAAMGGEPVKAYILKTHYGIGYRDSGVSLILAKTVILLALVLFLTIGFWMLAPADGLHASHKTIAWIGYAGLGLGIVLFYLIQRFRAASWLGRFLGGSGLALRLSNILSVIHEVDDRLARFYTEQRERFAGAFLLALANWLLGVAEVYLVMWLLGHPISFTDAWIIES